MEISDLCKIFAQISQIKTTIFQTKGIAIYRCSMPNLSKFRELQNRFTSTPNSNQIFSLYMSCSEQKYLKRLKYNFESKHSRMEINTAHKNYDPEFNMMIFKTSKNTSQQRLQRQELRPNQTIEGVDGHQVSYNLKQLKSLYHPLFNKEASREYTMNKFKVIKQENINKTHYPHEKLISIQSSICSNETKSIQEQDSNENINSDKTPTCFEKAIKRKRMNVANYSSSKKDKIKQFLYLNEDLNCDLSKEYDR